jgi:hypothetical protein
MAQNLRQWAYATAAFSSEGMKAAATNAPSHNYVLALEQRAKATGLHPSVKLESASIGHSIRMISASPAPA